MKKKILISLGILLGIFPLIGMVQGASLVSAKKGEITINPIKTEVERHQLWNKIGNFCAISSWHPAISDCQITRNKDFTLRTLTFKNGNSSEEKLLEQGTSEYKYEIVKSTLPVQNFQGMFSISPDDEDLNELNIQWSGTYDAKDKDDKEVRKTIDTLFSEGIQNILKIYGGKDKTRDKD